MILTHPTAPRWKYFRLHLQVISFCKNKRNTQKKKRKKQKKKKKVENNVLLSTTLINTQREIALPLFLVVEYPRDFRTGEILGKGGVSTIYKGEILEPKLRERYNGIDQVAVKFLNGNTPFFLFFFSFFFFLFSFFFSFSFLFSFFFFFLFLFSFSFLSINFFLFL